MNIENKTAIIETMVSKVLSKGHKVIPVGKDYIIHDPKANKDIGFFGLDATPWSLNPGYKNVYPDFESYEIMVK